MEQLVGMSLYDEHLMKAIYSRVIFVAGYIINVCDLRKGNLEDLGKIVKTALRDKEYHARQSNDEKLYAKIEEGGRSFKSFKDVYDETKVRVTCKISMSTNEWIAKYWRNELHKEQTSLKKEAKNTIKRVVYKFYLIKGI